MSQVVEERFIQGVSHNFLLLSSYRLPCNFDTVNHTILIGKLRKYDIRDIAGDWIQSYLENRKQFCAANGLNSGTKTVTCGILQGSCLGPLLFMIYFIDFEKCLIDSKAGLYADDTHITAVSTNVESLMQKTQMELSNTSPGCGYIN